MAKKASAAAGAVATTDAASGETCPNCGAARSLFGTVKALDPVDPANNQRTQIKEHRAKLADERGVLQRCPGCGYQTRAHDALVDAKA